MKRLPLLVACLTGLLAGIAFSLHGGTGASATASRVAPNVTAPPPRSGTHPDLVASLKKTPDLRGKTALMLGALSKGLHSDMASLVEAAGSDISQLLVLSDIALATTPAPFMTEIAKYARSNDGRDVVASRFAENWAKADFHAAFATSLEIPSPVGGWIGGVMLESLVATDPTAALKLAVAHPGLRLPWDQTHPIPATPENLDLIRALPPTAGKATMIEGISSNLEPDQAFALAIEDRGSNPLYGFLKVSRAMIKKDPRAAQAWCLANQDHPAAAQLARQISLHLVETNPAAAVDWAASHLSGSNRTSALTKAADALEASDPSSAKAARALLPEAFKTHGEP